MAEAKKRLSDEDQARVDKVINSGYNVTERKPFRPFRLALFLLAIVMAISGFSLLIARLNGIY
jgi:hypothetical protein